MAKWVGVVTGIKFAPNQVNVVERIKETGIINMLFFVIFMRNTFKSNQQLLQKYLSGNVRLIQLEISHLMESRTKFLPIFGSKMAKSDYFRGFYFSQSFLKVVSATFLPVCFVCLKKSTCQTNKNAFYFTSKALLILEIINF